MAKNKAILARRHKGTAKIKIKNCSRAEAQRTRRKSKSKSKAEREVRQEGAKAHKD
jgi:hypothetical protein